MEILILMVLFDIRFCRLTTTATVDILRQKVERLERSKR